MKSGYLLPWLALAEANGVGPVLAHQLLKHFNQPEGIFAATDQQLEDIGLTTGHIQGLRQASHNKDDYQSLWHWLEAEDHHLVCYGDALYPPQLSQVHAAPLMLYVKGDIEHLHKSQLAMVGSRNPTAAGRESAQQFAKSLSEAGLVVTSGLALGIDGAAHQGVLNAKGTTIAVMATGLDNIYPKRHQSLAQHILERGCLVSEFPLGTQPKPFHFPRRNRIISGLSLATFVVEATLKSGSLITAKYALEQNRDVFALPGSIYNPQSSGCHQLIKQGAGLVESVDDILKQLPGCRRSSQQTPTATVVEGLSVPEQEVMQLLDFHPVSLDWLVQQLKSDAASMAAILINLELNGRVCCEAGGYSKIS